MNILDYSSFYMVGIKGVAMTALAQCLLDAGKQVRGSDVAEAFVTEAILRERGIAVDVGFDGTIPTHCDCVIYTAAHQGPHNPQVVAALSVGLSTLSHAEALGSLFNQKTGVAVCGVGGKSTTSAMIAWILDQTGRQPSFAIGVGNIPGLNRTGQWRAASSVFVAEADEYVIDPSAPSRGEPITPRFSFLKPSITVCTNIVFDHPDVYRDFDQTLTVYETFFNQIVESGCLVVNSRQAALIKTRMPHLRSDLKLITYGEAIEDNQVDFQLIDFQSSAGRTQAVFRYQGETFELRLRLPGKYNVLNALGAVAAVTQLGVPLVESLVALAKFTSTLRRAEYKGQKNGVQYYDDYAHHPQEIKQVIHAFKEWFPNQRLVVAFQSHTFSRTKALLEEFITAFDEADEVLMTDIFASAREAFDGEISSDVLCQKINQRAGHDKARNLHDLKQLAVYVQSHLSNSDVCLTVGAGDIYQLHDMV